MTYPTHNSSCTTPSPWTTCGNTRTYTRTPEWPLCFPLTQTMIDHMEKICIPQLTAWSSRYRVGSLLLERSQYLPFPFQQCSTTITDKECAIPCQDKTNRFTCQETACRTTCGRTVCGYEGCLLGAAGVAAAACAADPTSAACAAGPAGAVAACQCNCFKTLLPFKANLTAIVDYPNFPICTEKYCGCLDCFKLVGFERLVKNGEMSVYVQPRLSSVETLPTVSTKEN